MGGEVCTSCGAAYGERCGTCGRELMCGSVSEFCDRDGCGRRVMARKYEPKTRPGAGMPTYEQIDQEAHVRRMSWSAVLREYEHTI